VASELLNDLKARADRADFNLLDNACPWADLKAEFLRWAKQSVRNPQDYERDLRRFEESCHPRLVCDVTPARIHAYRETRLNVGKCARTVNREVGTIANMLAKGVAWGPIATSPIASVKPLPHTEARKARRALSVDEVERLFDKSPPHLRAVWRMFMTTGIRKNELVGLVFSDVDFERRVITIRPSLSKSKKAREIPLDDAAYELLVDLRNKAAERRPVEGATARQTEQQSKNFSRGRRPAHRGGTISFGRSTWSAGEPGSRVPTARAAWTSTACGFHSARWRSSTGETPRTSRRS
jgi:integrase